MVIMLYMHRHHAQDLEGARNFLPSSNIIFLEYAVKDNAAELLHHFRSLSNTGKAKIKVRKEHEHKAPAEFQYFKAMNKLLKNCGKRIEIERSQFSLSSWRKVDELLARSILEMLVLRNFNRAKDYLEEYALQSNSMDDARENRIVEQIEDLQRENEDNNILALIGAAHTPIFWKLKEKGFEVKWYFSEKPFIFNYSSEILRKLKFWKLVEEDDLLRALFDRGISGYLKLLRKRTSGEENLPLNVEKKIELFSRKICEGNLEEMIRDLLPELREYMRGKAIGSENPPKIFKEYLKYEIGGN